MKVTLTLKLYHRLHGTALNLLLPSPFQNPDFVSINHQSIITPLFQDPDFASKIIPINGDIYEPELGISPQDVKTLEDNVSVVYHSAASVRFDDPIRLAVEMNVRC